MVKRLKLRLSRVISSLNSSCRSKNPSNLPRSPLPTTTTTNTAFFMLSPVNPKALDIDFPVPPKPHNRHVSSSRSIFSVNRWIPRSSSSHKPSHSPSSPLRTTRSHDHHNHDHGQQFRWKREEKWHVVAKVNERPDTSSSPRRKLCNSSVSDDSEGTAASPPPSPPRRAKSRPPVKKIKQNKRKKTKCKRNYRSRGRFSISSAESGWFSSDIGDENETETLVSSSTTEFDSTHLGTIRESDGTRIVDLKRNAKMGKGAKRVSSKNKRGVSSSGSESPARFSSVFQRLMPCRVEGKVKESFAVVKKSEDPYEDFKGSMLEMILAKQMFDVGDLEQLLHCFLALNSRRHHPVIVEAFSDIWEILFCESPLMSR